MNKPVHWFCVVLMLSLNVTLSAQMKAGRHSIELEDPVGDVQENKGKPGKDVTRFSMVSDGSHLHIMAELKENVEYYLKDQMAGPVIEVHFNTDNNDKTGGIAFWGKEKKGLEYMLELVACIRYKDGGMAALGALGGDIDGYCASYKIYQYAQDKKMPESLNSALEVVQDDITDNKISITIPYELVGIQSGTRMRLFIRESDGSFDDASYFPQVFFIVK